jgi:hypothetical protein
MKGMCLQKWLILGSPKEKNQVVPTPSLTPELFRKSEDHVGPSGQVS